jgi:hypothetical protein
MSTVDILGISFGSKGLGVGVKERVRIGRRGADKDRGVLVRYNRERLL